MSQRRDERVPLIVEVEYRSAGSFLVAFSANLSASGIFVETAQPLPVGGVLSLRLTVPGMGPLEVQGTVAWTRHIAAPDNPAGMGIRIAEPVDSRYGAVVDQLAATFRGLRVAVMALNPEIRTRLARTVRGILTTALVIEAHDSVVVEAALDSEIDLLILNADDDQAEGIVSLRLAKLTQESPVPVIVATRSPANAERAKELGADEVLGDPPSLRDLQGAILRVIGKPLRVGL